MRLGDLQIGAPQVLFGGTRSFIEALAGQVEGSLAYATDDNLMGLHNGTSWGWMSPEHIIANNILLEAATSISIQAPTIYFDGDYIGYGATTLNTNSADFDTIIKGSSDGALIFVDASTDRVGIGDSTPSYKLDVNGDINTTGALRISGTDVFTVLHREWVPFGVYDSIAPFTATKIPYMATVDRTMTFIKWTQAFAVLTTNDATNYWKIKLYKIDGTLIKQLDTSAATNNVWSSVNATTFDVGSIGTATVSMYIEVSKNNAPGDLYLAGPALEVSV